MEEIQTGIEDAAPEPDPMPAPTRSRPRKYDELADLMFGPRAIAVTNTGPDDRPQYIPPSSGDEKAKTIRPNDGAGGKAPTEGKLTARVSPGHELVGT